MAHAQRWSRTQRCAHDQPYASTSLARRGCYERERGEPKPPHLRSAPTSPPALAGILRGWGGGREE
eukprot:scaffold272598_cov30-Tisochrysis_lutea.AAC.1